MVFRVREGYAPPGGALVVRGGIMRTSDIEKAARVCKRKHDVLGITVFSADVPGFGQLLEQIPDPGRWRRLSVATVADIDDFELLPTGKAPHYTLVLPGMEMDDAMPDLPVMKQLRGRFAIVDNPLFSARA